MTLRRKPLCRKDSLPKRHLAEKNRRMLHFAEKLFLPNLPNTVKNLILCQGFKMLIEITMILIPSWILTCPGIFKVDTIICLMNVNTFSGIYPRLNDL